MKLPRYLPSSNAPKEDDLFGKDLDRSLDKIFAMLFEILNTGLKFEDNFNCFKTTVTTDATPGVEMAIAHGLAKTPVGFIILSKDKAAHLFDGQSGKDGTNYYIQSDLASVKVTLVIIGG